MSQMIAFVYKKTFLHPKYVAHSSIPGDEPAGRCEKYLYLVACRVLLFSASSLAKLWGKSWQPRAQPRYCQSQ